MSSLPKSLEEVVEYFARLPGIGKKSASRIAFSLLQKTPEYQEKFGDAISCLSKSIGTCDQCFHLCESEETLCGVCKNPRRDTDTLCVVESSLDLLALEKSGSFTGLYFVLGGVISPMDGIGPEQIRIKQLKENISHHQYSEIIFALSSTMEGEATTVYIANDIESLYSGTISRIARGISLGSSIQYTDENTLGRAFAGRGGI